jgi:hypothetical protein
MRIVHPSDPNGWPRIMLRSESTGFEDAVAQARPQVLKVFVPRQLEDEPVVARRILPCDHRRNHLRNAGKAVREIWPNPRDFSFDVVADVRSPPDRPCGMRIR